MHLLIDEDVPQSVAEFFLERGHEVTFVRDILLPGTSDRVIAAVGDDMEVVIVTWNQKDFRRLASRTPPSTGRMFRRLGRISFRCNETRGRARLAQVIESIEFEFAQAQQSSDPRLIMEIGENFFRVMR